MQNNKPNVLLVESGGHYKVLPHLYLMLSKVFDVEVLLPKSGISKVSFIPECKLVSCLSMYFIFLSALFRGRQYDYLYIATAPQYGRSGIDFYYVLSFLILVFFYGDKVIVHIRDNNKFFSSGSVYQNLLGYLRRKSVLDARLICFESKTLLSNFKDMASCDDSKLFVAYVYYSDFNFVDYVAFPYDSRSSIKIGLTGSIDSFRRDYDTLIHALGLLKPEVVNRISFAVLGECSGQAMHVINQIEKYCPVQYAPGYISDDDFLDIGSSCDFLLSPLKSELGYGLNKGTGAFGDAIFLKKNLLLPSFADPYVEYSAFSSYYEEGDSDSLAKSIDLFVNSPSSLILDDGCFDSFSSISVSNELAHKLS
ncbi:hypothetical protein [Neptuniibacter halophilus]|uniref:hypothetical protein n=1 Tax=Neptuniibacter halophilus TaxID=651666 RepID=UPI0025736016|nr:hypothetical protein [Neptuniibacter halophilus]